MKPRIAVTVLTSLLISGLPGLAKPPLLSGQVAQEQVTQLTTEIPWYQSLSQAEQAAKSQGKLVFWMHMLGSLSGGT